MFTIGNIEVKSKTILAPMAGITSRSYRSFLRSFGTDLTYTEMVSDCGINYKNKETYTYLDIDKEDHPVAVQLFGGSVKSLQKATEIIQKLPICYELLDINLGCPVPKVTKSNAGSAWLKREEELFLMVKKIVSISTKPVTAKIRLGWDIEHINFLKIISLLEDAGVSAIAIHARTTKELYSGKPHYELLENLREKMRVPLIVSGNIFTLDDAINALDITKADAVMVARGGIGNPWLIRQIEHYYKTGERLPEATLDQQIQFLLKLAEGLIEEKGEYKGIRILRGIAPKYFFNMPSAKNVRVRLSQEMQTFADLKRIVFEYRKEIESINEQNVVK